MAAVLQLNVNPVQHDEVESRANRFDCKVVGSIYVGSRVSVASILFRLRLTNLP